jgi:hypothetical protein
MFQNSGGSEAEDSISAKKTVKRETGSNSTQTGIVMVTEPTEVPLTEQ